MLYKRVEIKIVRFMLILLKDLILACVYGYAKRGRPVNKILRVKICNAPGGQRPRIKATMMMSSMDPSIT